MSDFGRFAVDGRERRLYTTFHVGTASGHSLLGLAAGEEKGARGDE